MRTEYNEGKLLTKDDVGLVFRDRNGKNVKILAFLDLLYLPILVVDEDNKITRRYTENGRFKFEGVGLSNGASEFDLVSFVGSDFSEDKKLRKFKFEAFIGEHQSSPPNEHNTVQLALGHYTTILHNDLLTLDSTVNNTSCNKISKWEVIMKELPNE